MKIALLVAHMFMRDGITPERCAKGDEIDVPDAYGVELIDQGKAEQIVEPKHERKPDTDAKTDSKPKNSEKPKGNDKPKGSDKTGEQAQTTPASTSGDEAPGSGAADSDSGDPKDAGGADGE